MKKWLFLLVPVALTLSGCCECGTQVMKNDGVTESHRTDKGLEIRLKGDVAFETKSADLRDVAKAAVDDLAKDFLKKKVKALTVVGYSDNRGSETYNLKLSNARAVAVKNRLVEKGLDGSKITTEGKGFEDPIGSNDTEEGRSKNRRVEILVQE